jgi:hypothetical protein
MRTFVGFSSSARDRPATGAMGLRPLVGAVAYGVHGIVFLALVGAALMHFGSIFAVVGAIVAAIALGSLHQAWIGFRHYFET